MTLVWNTLTLRNAKQEQRSVEPVNVLGCVQGQIPTLENDTIHPIKTQFCVSSTDESMKLVQAPVREIRARQSSVKSRFIP